MKKLLSVLLVTLSAAFTLPAAALCEVRVPPPALTGTAGSKSAAAPNAEYVTSIQPWTTPTPEPYSLAVMTNVGGPSKISFGATSGAVVRIGSACNSSGLTCANGYTGVPGTRLTKLQMSWTQEADGTYVTRVVANTVKVMELYGVAATGTIQNTQTFSDGIGRIMQETPTSRRLFVEGYNTVSGVTSWKSVAISFSRLCMTTALLDARDLRDRVASVGFAVMPEYVAAKQWWMT